MNRIVAKGFNEVYEGINGDKRVRVILDDNCVRLMVFINGKLKRRSEFGNGDKIKCMHNATMILAK